METSRCYEQKKNGFSPFNRFRMNALKSIITISIRWSGVRCVACDARMKNENTLFLSFFNLVNDDENFHMSTYQHNYSDIVVRMQIRQHVITI